MTQTGILVNFWIKESDKQTIKTKAEQMGLSLSSYMRMAALTYDPHAEYPGTKHQGSRSGGAER
jgi:hypothetical protein